MEETEKRKQTINMILRASLICFICCLSAAWAVYGRILLESLGLKGWWIVLALFIFLVIVSVCCCIRQKKWREIVTVAFFLGLAFFLPLEFKWQGLLAALCLGLALLMPAWRRLPKNSHRSLKPQEDEKYGRAHMYRKHWAQIFRRIEEQNMKPEQQRRGLCVAVSGEWGSGKTHFLSHTIYELDYWGRAKEEDGKEMTKHDYTGRFFSASVDLWKETSDEDMWREIANALAYTARGYRSDCFLGNKLVKSVLQLCHLPLPLADDTAKLLSLGGDGESLIHSRIGREIQRQNHYSLLVLDNIDRCSIGRLRSLFPAIESLSRIPNLVILCGVAKGNMTSVMGKEAPALCSALLKICDDEIHIPLLTKSESDFFLWGLQANRETCFEKWFRNQKFYDVSPRLAKKIHAHHSWMFKIYLESPLKRVMEMGEEGGSFVETCYETIFNFEALRIAFPNCPLPVPDQITDKEDESSDNDGKRIFDEIKLSNEIDTFDDWRKFIRKRYGRVRYGEEDPTRHGLFRIASKLSKADNAALAYLRNQNYWRITRLTDKECEAVLKMKQLNFSDILGAEMRGAEIIGDAIGGHVDAVDMPAVIESLYDHCVTQSKLTKCLDFMKAFFEHDWLLKLNLQDIFPLDYATALLRLNSPQKDKDYFCQRILPIYRFESLAYIANIILTCQQDKDAWNYDYIFNGRKAAWGTRMMLQAFHNNWEKPSYKVVLDSVLLEYAKKACESILTYKGNMIHDYYKHLILGQSNQPKSYGPALLAGAKQYLASYASKSSDIPQLLKTVTVVDVLSDRPVPFAALSFAVIWKVLFKKLVTPKELEEANKEEIRKLQKLITATPPPKKGVSKQFQDNWQAALNVFKNSLK